MGTDLLWEELIQPGATWSHVLKRGTALRITDMMGGANAGMFYNAELPVERYNMPDTLKAQHIARLTAGFVLYSDMGRVLCSITDDTVGWHDPIGGCSNAALVAREVRRGPLSGVPQRLAQERVTTAFSSNWASGGWARATWSPNVNFFSRVDGGRRRQHAVRARQFARRDRRWNCAPR